MARTPDNRESRFCSGHFSKYYKDWIPSEAANMPWTINRLCRDGVDTGCVSVCPVDCIYEYVGADKVKFPNQLYIDPDECIDCGACEPECPWQAIFEEPAVPDVLKDDIALNHAVLEQKDNFKVKAFVQ